MGKVKTRLLGMEDVEEKQKKDQKEKAAQKKALKKKNVVVKKAKDEVVEKAPVVLKAPKPAKKTIVKIKPRGKRYEESKKILDSKKTYDLKEAIVILKKMKSAKFDESVEIHFVVDEIGLKGEVDLPHSTGKIIKIAVVDDKVLEEIEKGKLDFDMLVTHPSFMPKLAKYAKILGPKGLMPNPKAGTISPKPEEIVKKFARGVLRWKTEAKAPLIHQMVGKLSFEDKKLQENCLKLIQSVGEKHILKVNIKSTMSPSIKLTIKN